MQDVPICWDCEEPVRPSDAVFEAPCGHDNCSSAVFHGLCLMVWREKREARDRTLRRFRDHIVGVIVAHRADADSDIDEPPSADEGDEDDSSPPGSGLFLPPGGFIGPFPFPFPPPFPPNLPFRPPSG